MNISKIKDVFKSCCPVCKHVLVEHFHESNTYHVKNCVFLDGDTIFGLWQKLTIEQKDYQHSDYEFLVGRCDSCESSYYCVVLGFINSSDGESEQYLFGNREMELKNNYICSKDNITPWLVSVYDTPLGELHRHWLEFISIKNEDNIIGPNGVSACCSEGSEWDDAALQVLKVFDDAMQLSLLGVSQTLKANRETEE